MKTALFTCPIPSMSEKRMRSSMRNMRGEWNPSYFRSASGRSSEDVRSRAWATSTPCNLVGRPLPPGLALLLADILPTGACGAGERPYFGELHEYNDPQH